MSPLSAGAGDELRPVYLLEPRAVALNGLRAGTPYRLEWFNPVTGVRQPVSQLLADTRGNAVVTPPDDEPRDWAAVIKSNSSAELRGYLAKGRSAEGGDLLTPRVLRVRSDTWHGIAV